MDTETEIKETEMYTKEYKKIQMLAIRKMVKDHITSKNKGNVPYLAKLDLSPADNTRMIIALQDMVDDERARHSRARKHIVKLIELKNKLMVKCVEISNAIYELNQRLKQFSEQLMDQDHQIADLQAKLKTKDEVINGLMQMKWEQEAVAKAPASVTIGESNRNSGRWQAVPVTQERG